MVSLFSISRGFLFASRTTDQINVNTVYFVNQAREFVYAMNEHAIANVYSFELPS